MNFRIPVALVASGLAVTATVAGQDVPPDVVARAKAAEARRVAIVEKLSPAVGAFFQKATVGQGGGSGVVIDPRGYAITNFHVSLVEHDLLVGLDDGKLYKAKLLGIDPGGDIALAKLEGKERFSFVPMGNSDEVRPGDRVLVMGNPFLLATDFHPTVTEGVVSGVHRFRDATGGTDLVYGDCIQIDASINPGNSGGPLFDEDGRWIGINGLGGFRPDRGRVNVGVGYAASVDQIKNFIEDLRSGQQAEHGTMDATVRDIQDEDDVTRTLVKIDAIVNDSVAYVAGLRLGDVLVEFDGVPVRTQNQFLTLISRLPAGRRVRVTFDRRREDASIGGAKNYDRKTIGFRLKGVPSGPEEGKWQPDEEAMAAERRSTLATARAGTRPHLDPGRGFELKGERREPSSEPVSWRLAQKGAKVRIDAGKVSIGTNGTDAWRRLANGQVEALPQAEADILQGTAVALDAILRDAGEADLNEVKFTGGESILGKRTSRLETRDKSGRRRKLYFDTTAGRLMGWAHATDAGGDKWVEVRLHWSGNTVAKLERVEDQTGESLGEDVVTSSGSLTDEDTIFERPPAAPPKEGNK